jgi:CopG family nickel-responsive transcriptional regulator
MSIISLSIDDETESKIENIMSVSAYDNRSELIRKAVTDLHQDSVKKDQFETGKGLMIVKHPHESEHKVSELLHSKDDIIETQLHSKLDEEDCIEILLVEGAAESIKDMKKDLKGSKSTERVETIIF